MQLSSRILTALAVLILSVAVLTLRGVSPEGVEAATGTIDVLNVGTCYTTNDDIFSASDCKDGYEDTGDDAVYDVAGRTTITESSSVFATYAIDPKTSGEAPRAILENADLIKISINDKDRDRRTGVLYGVGSTTDPVADQRTVIDDVLDSLTNDLKNDDSPPITVTTSTKDGVGNSSNFTIAGESIDSSGLYRINLEGTGNTLHPMAPRDDGKIVWFGCVVDTARTPCDDAGTTTRDDPYDDFQDLKDFISLDEDLASGTRGSVAPWMRITASVRDAKVVVIEYIYYQTSRQEMLVGGCQMDDYSGTTDAGDGCVIAAKTDAPNFVDNEDKVDGDALFLGAGSDGDVVDQNLWLKETGDFTGVYEGYVRLTDADGFGDDGSTPDVRDRNNWGRETKNAASESMTDAAVLGVESGPVTIRYKNSKGDIRTATILIDKTPPAIQIDAPVHNISSKDDSPDLLGSFNDGGGSGLRDNSFRVYADNRDDSNDGKPIWDFRVDSETGKFGHVCADADEDKPDPATTTGCEPNGIVALRGHYAGFKIGDGTFGIIPSKDVYIPSTEDKDKDGANDYKTANAEDYEDGDTSGLFDSVVRIDFPPPATDNKRYNNAIDIQAVVLDIAGNFGFSDSQASEPTFIHDLGTVSKDRAKTKTHNVLGWYSRHTYRLDDVDPYYMGDQSATGFYTNENGDETISNSGLKVVFDNDLDAASVGTDTFVVKLDNGDNATITSVDVDGRNVYLMLDEELAPDATPSIDLATGASILDLAGNESTDRRLDGIELNDGILPTFTITLSGGSGLNEDIAGEGSSELTRGQMTISIESDEDIQGAPKFTVICSNLQFDGSADNDVAKYASNRSGAMTAAPTAETKTMCGDLAKSVAETSALARPGNRWEYLWANLSGDPATAGNQAMQDGKLSVIVWGRDRSTYKKSDGMTNLYNWSSSTTSFNYDTDLKAAWETGDGSELVPDNGENVFEPRPFVLLDFGDEKTTVNVTKFTVDKVDHTAELQILEDNEFVWWPEPLAYGKYTVNVEANDAANNPGDHTYSFTVKERAPFTLSLLAGWNSVSFPANPIDRALHAVFTNEAVDRVVGWNVTEPVSPWRLATRVDGVWTTGEEYATLNDVEARYGYWVHSTGFITQSVDLSGKGDRATDGQPSPADIPTDTGWNFVGVVDVDGDQTQDDAGETLRNSNNDPITAAEYLGNYTRAYTWDHVNNTWDVVKTDEGITIGTGVWVYYTSDHDIAP